MYKLQILTASRVDSIYSVIWKLLSLVLPMLGFLGCAMSPSQTQDYFATTLEIHGSEISKVALVTDLTPPKIELEDLGLTRGESASKGALDGVAQAVAQGGPIAIIFPVFIFAGALGGSIYGAATGYSADTLEKAKAQVGYIINSGYQQNILLNDVANYGGHNTDIEFVRVPSADQAILSDNPDYMELVKGTFDAVLEVVLQQLALQEISPGSKYIEFTMNTRVRLISLHTGAVLKDVHFRYKSRIHKHKELIDDNAQLLSSEIRAGLERVAADAIDENLLLFIQKSQKT